MAFVIARYVFPEFVQCSPVAISLLAHGDKYFGEIANFTMAFDYVRRNVSSR